jgi:hypothetical protein
MDPHIILAILVGVIAIFFISLIAFSYLWFSRVETLTKSSTNTTQSQIDNTMSMQAKRVSIENIDTANNVVIVRNIGSQSLAGTDLTLFVNGVKTSCLGGAKDWPSSITPGSTGSCDWGDGSACTSGTSIKVTAPGNFDESQCP